MAIELKRNVDKTDGESPEVGRDDEPVAPMIARSLDAFRSDLPQLLRTHARKWVAYHGDERIAFARRRTKLYNKCRRRGLKQDEFLVLLVMAETADEDINWSWNV